MKQTSRKTAKRLTAEQISTRVLYALVAVSVAVFGAFFFVDFDTPFEDNPEFNAPPLTDLLLVFIYILVGATVALAVVSVASGIRKRDKSQATANNIPVGKTALGTALLLVVSMAVTFALGSSSPVMANGTEYTDTFWLKATDMFINTSLVMLTVAACGVVFGVSGMSRRFK